MEKEKRDRQHSGGEGAHGTNDTEMPADNEDQETNDTVGDDPKIPIRGRKKNKKLKTKINDKNDEIERLKSQVQDAESQLQTAEEKNKELQDTVQPHRKKNSNKETDSLKQTLSKAISDKNKHSKDIEKLNMKIDDLKKETKEQEKRNKEDFKKYATNMENKAEKYEAEMVSLKAELTQALASAKKEKKKHDSEKQEMLLRLSKVAGANLKLANPNIADLSDEERPTKLAEDFSELYDNEWTDAFEVLKTDEKDRTTFMLLLLQRASTLCQQISNDHMQSIKESLCSMTLRPQLPKAFDVGTNEIFGILKNDKNQVLRNKVITMPFDSLQTDQRKVVMDLRKFVEKQLSNQLEMEVANVIASENDIILEGEDTVVKYIKKCVNICWTMCKHEPPVHIDFPNLQVNHKFDTYVYKPYKKSGKYLHFIVWPALYLYKDGPLLCKGVAQGNN